MLTINQGHNDRISGDPRIQTTSAAVSDLKPHKVNCLGKPPIKLPALDIVLLSKYSDCKNIVRIFTGLSIILHGAKVSYSIKKLIWKYKHYNELQGKNEGSIKGTGRGANSESTIFKPQHTSYRSGKGGNSSWSFITPFISKSH